LNGLADRGRRAEAAGALARYWGAEALIVFICDPELGVLRPAPGFPQILPGGPSWRRFLARCRELGEHRDSVAFPDRETMTEARAFVAEDGAVLMLLGGSPSLSRAEFAELPFGLLSALLRAESVEAATAGRIEAARDATRRATALAEGLDVARSQAAAKAAELAAALAEAARLNQQLRDLNETLEQRVRERTRSLEKETEERIKAQTALLQAQKMEAVGQLTGGVAHDFNNLLSVVIGALESIQGLSEHNPRLERLVKLAQRAAQRGEVLTQKLLAFSRQQVLRSQLVELNDLIRDCEPLVRRAIGETVRLETRFSRTPCRCHIDPVQFETAILNLAVNARDAMPAGGTLVIETAVCRDEGRERRPEMGPGPYVRITVRDNGSGMTPDILARVFEPFFTTKPVGKGTGLGLSQVHGFVHQSGGWVEIDSTLGKATEVRLYLPVAQPEPARAERRRARKVEPASEGETVLVVEDEPDVADMVLSMLDGLGYRTEFARNGKEALSILERNPAIDLLFTDLVMPGGMSGAQLAIAARRLRPHLKILLTSGYAAHPAIADDGLREGFPLISKPYRLNELAAAVRAALGEVADNGS
jgi:signal transduction histidine kinase/ActR/RegA family two-component response regulator